VKKRRIFLSNYYFCGIPTGFLCNFAILRQLCTVASAVDLNLAVHYRCDKSKSDACVVRMRSVFVQNEQTGGRNSVKRYKKARTVSARKRKNVEDATYRDDRPSLPISACRHGNVASALDARMQCVFAPGIARMRSNQCDAFQCEQLQCEELAS